LAKVVVLVDVSPFVLISGWDYLNCCCIIVSLTHYIIRNMAE